jgi:hypothetical protein
MFVFYDVGADLKYIDKLYQYLVWKRKTPNKTFAIETNLNTFCFS